MATYQHVLPGMGAEAAGRFSQLLAASRWTSTGPSTGEPTNRNGSQNWSVNRPGRRTSRPATSKARNPLRFRAFQLVAGQDLNLRPSGYEAVVGPGSPRFVPLHLAPPGFSTSSRPGPYRPVLKIAAETPAELSMQGDCSNLGLGRSRGGARWRSPSPGGAAHERWRLSDVDHDRHSQRGTGSDHDVTSRDDA